MRLFRYLTVIVFLSVFTTGCATIINGYYSKVELKFTPDSLRIVTIHGEEIPIHTDTVNAFIIPRIYKTISLRGDRAHILRLQKGETEKIVTAYPQIAPGWLLLDLLFGGFPAIIDMYTGAWNYFEDIDAMIGT